VNRQTVGIDLSELRYDPDMQAILTNATLNIAIVNDIYSFKKEVSHTSFAYANNLVKVYYLQYNNVQKAIEQACVKVEQTITELDKASERILLRYSAESDISLNKALAEYITHTKAMCYGHLVWGYKSERYSLRVESLEGGVDLIL
jgi:hypothetical protein